MRSIRALSAIFGITAFAAFAATPEVLDLAARVHYGYYHADPRTIDTALTALERLPDSPEVSYYRDFAALRRAQLGGSDRAGQQRLRACAAREVSAELDKRAAAEAWVLIAACAEAAGDDGRRVHALAAARERDDDNPRIALVEVWALEREAAEDATRRDAAAAKAAAAAEAFDAWEPSIDDPDWGHAEVLTSLAAAALQRGQARVARDLIERALLLAPDFAAALELRVALQSSRSDRMP